MEHQFIVICRRASDPLLPGSKTGYQCAICGLEVAVTPPGQQVIADGGEPLCNSCGFEFIDLAQQSNTPIFPLASPDAADQLRKLMQQMKDRHRAN